MEDIQNATLAGGVAMGAAACMCVDPFGALLVGFVSGILSSCGFVYGTPFLRKIGIDDTCGVNNLHGMPAVLGTIASAIAAAVATPEKYGSNEDLVYIFPARASCENFVQSRTNGILCGRSAGEQACWQLAALAVTLAFALFGGVLAGSLARLSVFLPPKSCDCYEDGPTWTISDGDVKDLESWMREVRDDQMKTDQTPIKMMYEKPEPYQENMIQLRETAVKKDQSPTTVWNDSAAKAKKEQSPTAAWNDSAPRRAATLPTDKSESDHPLAVDNF